MMSLLALLGMWLVIGGLCALCCAAAGWWGSVSTGGDERARSSEQWQRMCEALDLDDLSDGRTVATAVRIEPPHEKQVAGRP